MKCGITALSLFSKIIMIVRHKSSRQVEYLTSIFAIPCSTFDILLSEFLFRLDRPFFWPAAGLTPDTMNGNFIKSKN